MGAGQPCDATADDCDTHGSSFLFMAGEALAEYQTQARG